MDDNDNIIIIIIIIIMSGQKLWGVPCHQDASNPQVEPAAEAHQDLHVIMTAMIVCGLDQEIASSRSFGRPRGC